MGRKREEKSQKFRPVFLPPAGGGNGSHSHRGGKPDHRSGRGAAITVFIESQRRPDPDAAVSYRAGAVRFGPAGVRKCN